MSDTMQIEVTVDEGALDSILRELVNDDAVMTQVHNTLARYCDPYVPMQTGVLAQTIEVTPEYLKYLSPYAHYQYTGLVYGPNIPIFEDGVITGWWSPPQKSPTGEALTYNGEQHPLATSQWDKAMMRDRKDEFVQEVTRILAERARNL